MPLFPPASPPPRRSLELRKEPERSSSHFSCTLPSCLPLPVSTWKYIPYSSTLQGPSLSNHRFSFDLACSSPPLPQPERNLYLLLIPFVFLISPNLPLFLGRDGLR